MITLENNFSLIRHCLTLEKLFPQNLSIQEMITQHRWKTVGGKGCIYAFISKRKGRRAIVPLSEEYVGGNKEAADPLLVLSQ